MNSEYRLLLDIVEKEFVNVKEKLVYVSLLQNELVAEDKIQREIIMSFTLIKGYLVELQSASLLKNSTFFNTLSHIEEKMLHDCKKRKILKNINKYIDEINEMYLELNSLLPLSLTQKEVHFHDIEVKFIEKTQGIFSQHHISTLENKLGKKKAIVELCEELLPYLRNLRDEVEEYCTNFTKNKKVQKNIILAIEELGREIYFDSERELLLDKQEAYSKKLKELYTLLQKIK